MAIGVWRLAIGKNDERQSPLAKRHAPTQCFFFGAGFGAGLGAGFGAVLAPPSPSDRLSSTLTVCVICSEPVVVALGGAVAGAMVCVCALAGSFVAPPWRWQLISSRSAIVAGKSFLTFSRMNLRRTPMQFP
jgi:hypothetical protein